MSESTVKVMEQDAGWVAFGKMIAVLVSIAWGVCTYAYTIRALWAWFVVPTFHLAPLTFGVAAGLDVIVTLLRGYPTTPSSDEDAGTLAGRALGRATFYPAFVLLIGWIVMRASA